MQEHKAPDWLKLDNAAKIYPPAMSRKWAAMFRLSVTLTEPVDTDLLEAALNKTLCRIPTFSYQLRHGVFWYYLERMDTTPEIQKDAGNPLLRMDFPNNRNFMFRVRCHNNRIALEIFHALTDGMGGLTFLLTMTAEYLRLKYDDVIPFSERILDCDKEPVKQEMEDSFLHVARKAVHDRQESVAYHITGSAEQTDFLHIITGIIPIQNIRDAANAKDCSMTAFLVSLMINAIQELQKNRPVDRQSRLIKVSIPVNLRRFYKSNTMRNFSSYVNVGIDSSLGDYTLEEIIVQVKHQMGLEITEKNLNARFSLNVKAERNKAVRMMPLAVKVPVLKAVHKLQGDRYCTTTLSNLGSVELPEPMAGRVTRMDFLLGASRSNAVSFACVGYGENLYLTSTRVIEETDLERNFFTQLVKMGIPVKIESNQRW